MAGEGAHNSCYCISGHFLGDKKGRLIYSLASTIHLPPSILMDGGLSHISKCTFVSSEQVLWHWTSPSTEKAQSGMQGTSNVGMRWLFWMLC